MEKYSAWKIDLKAKQNFSCSSLFEEWKEEEEGEEGEEGRLRLVQFKEPRY